MLILLFQTYTIYQIYYNKQNQLLAMLATKKERNTLKELLEDQILIMKKAGKGNIVLLMAKHCCNTMVMKHLLNTSRHQKVYINRYKRLFSKLKSLIKKHQSRFKYQLEAIKLLFITKGT